MCVDSGPWVCVETGCPAPSLSCAALANLGTCKSSFGQIWKDAPVGTNNSLVESLCPVSCGTCPAWLTHDHSSWTAVRRYQPFSLDEKKQGQRPEIADGTRGPALKLTQQRFEAHLVTAEPFIIAIEDAPAPQYESLDAFSAVMNATWHSEIRMWPGRLSTAAFQAYREWFESGNRLDFGNFREVRKSFPGSYLSIRSGTSDDEYMIRRVFDSPPFMPQEAVRTGGGAYWMYAGERGAGVLEHIDMTGCVCSWSYQVFGTKRWMLRTPPGLRDPEGRYGVLQNAGDFFFWCVGYYHETVIESPESLSMHGYVFLDIRTPSAYANLVSLISNETMRKHGAQDEHVWAITQLANDCEKDHQRVADKSPQGQCPAA